MPASVKDEITRCAGVAEACTRSRACMMTGAEGKNSASANAIMRLCRASDLDSIIHRASHRSMRAWVSPPLGRKRTAPRRSPAQLCSTKGRHRSSVQIVTIQPRRSAKPRASATKGCTSPRVPRVIMKTCLWLGLGFGVRVRGSG